MRIGRDDTGQMEESRKVRRRGGRNIVKHESYRAGLIF